MLGIPLIIDSHASENAVRVVLIQVVNGVEQPIHFWSQVLKKYQTNWHISRKECYVYFKRHKEVITLLNW